MTTTTTTAPITYIAFDEENFWGSGDTAEAAEADARATLESGIPDEEVKQAMAELRIERVAMYGMGEYDGPTENIIFIGDISYAGQTYAEAVKAE